MNHAVIVGAQRSGSTYLLSLLDEHPQIAMARPVRPEPKVFLDDEILTRGADWYRATYFSHATDDTTLLGEKGTTYCERPDAALRIQQVLPGAKILMIVRDPVERAISNHRFSVDNGLESLPLEQALAVEGERAGGIAGVSTSPFAYRQRGHYAQYIAPYREMFGPEAFKVLVLEDLVGNRAEVAALYRWLGVDDSVIPASLSRVVNASTRTNAPADAGVRADLAAGYEGSVDRLEEMLGRSLSVWRAGWQRV